MVLEIPVFETGRIISTKGLAYPHGLYRISKEALPGFTTGTLAERRYAGAFIWYQAGEFSGL